MSGRMEVKKSHERQRLYDNERKILTEIDIDRERQTGKERETERKTMNRREKCSDGT